MNINAIMQQAQKMQKQLAEAESALEKEVYDFEGQQGAIKLQLRGDGQILKIDIDKDLLDEDSKEILEDMLILTLNDGLLHVSVKKDELMQSITGNVKIPGM